MNSNLDVPQQSFETADDLLAALRPLDTRWGARPDHWIFRGHGSSSWRLFPTAFRAEAWVGFEEPGTPSHDPLAGYQSHIIQDQKETEVLQRFLRQLDGSGLPIPGDPDVCRSALRDAVGNLTSHGIPAAVRPLAALARHHGLPTRLLDWTTRGVIAAYFAASAEVSGNAGDLLIWALDTSFLRRFAHHATRLRIEMFAPPRASNPNLHAQGGVLLTCVGNLGKLAPFDDFVWHIVRELQSVPEPPSSPLRRFLLPRSQAPLLLRLLSYEGITGSSMFPGVDGVVRSIRERSRWDKAVLDE